MIRAAESPATTRRTLSEKIVLAVVSIGLLLIVIAYALSRPLEDFLEYWTAGHLLLAHQNPYSLPETFAMEKALGWNQPIPFPWVRQVEYKE